MATVMPDVASITSLDNYNLSGQAMFDKNTGEMLNIFLTRLPSPVCIVAHNGNLYDFPLLKAEMEKAGTKLESQICVWIPIWD
jgi:three prime repair exonuclease-1